MQPLHIYTHQYFPHIIAPEYMYRGLHYIFGCHPYSKTSLVSSVGTVSKRNTYGINRADISVIAEGIMSGILVLDSNFPGNKKDWPFFWGENEVMVGECDDYVFLTAAAAQQAGNPNSGRL